MRIFTPLVFILVLVSLVTCQPNTPTTTLGGEPTEIATESISAPTPTPLASTAWADRTIFGQGLIEAEQEVLDLLQGTSVYHLDFQISDNFLLLVGHEEVRYTNRENEPLDEVYFRLFPNAAGGKASVSAVKVDGQEVEPVYEFENSALRVPLPVALQPGEQVNIQKVFINKWGIVIFFIDKSYPLP